MSDAQTITQPQANGVILPDLASLERENAALKAELAERPAGKLSAKVSQKTGAVSVYGLQRFPVTLYREQWERLFAARGQIEAICATAPVRAPR